MPKKQSKTVLRMIYGGWKRGLLLGFSGITLGALLSVPVVHADVYQQPINSLTNQTSQTQSLLASLQSTATTYQGAITSLESQIDAIQTSIRANQAAEAADTAKISADQAQISQNKQILSDDIKTMYVDGQMSTIEELATSKNLSDYVDAQEYRGLIQDKVTDLLQSIQSLESQAQTQKQQVIVLLATEQSQQAQVTADEAQESQLLSANQGQQDQYNQQITSNNSQISSLKAQQAAANASIAKSVRVSATASSGGGGACDIGSGNGGYPAAWCDTAQDAITDSNGFPNRECTSFAYWYFTTQEGQSSFRVSGNAGWWWETSNYAVSTYPDVKVGALGVEPSSSLNAPVPSLHGGYYGHVMVVLADGSSSGTTYNGSLPYTSAAAGTYVPAGDVLVMSMNEDEEGHFMYNLWPADYLMYINPQ
jgi:peptidoglycan hydrolase CwlO-like protein